MMDEKAEKIRWEVSSFDGLDVFSLYKILQLRTETFVVEQKGIYQDMDDKDFTAIHLQGFIGDRLIAYCRMFRSGDYFDHASIGRVIVALPYQGKGYGHLLMDKSLEIMSKLLNENSVTISAQAHLQQFYESHGFTRISELYMEEGIPHIRMERKTKESNE